MLNGLVARYVRKDAAYRRAKREGLRSRAAYKLEELDRRFGLFRRGARVVDLGCWPGGWLQVAARRVGPRGRVVGVDLRPVDGLGGPAIELITADVADAAVVEAVREALGGPADVVLSDLAPRLSGIRQADAARHAELVRLASERALAWLTPGGTFVAKLFMDPEYEGLIRELRAGFERVRSCKTEATRRGSSELYVVARQPRRAEPFAPGPSPDPRERPASGHDASRGGGMRAGRAAAPGSSGPSEYGREARPSPGRPSPVSTAGAAATGIGATCVDSEG